MRQKISRDTNTDTTETTNQPTTKKTRDRRCKFERWLSEISPEKEWNWKYQRYIYKKLAAVTSGKRKRLMVFLPPRHGKTELITMRYTLWRLLNDPQLNVILASHTQKLANKFSRNIRRLVDSGKLIVDRKRSSRSQPSTINSQPAVSRRLNTASEWETAGGGVVRAVGVTGGITGFGAGLIVIDDPVKNRADAESATYRERVWDWFNDDIYTRMEPNAAIILIQTRWHEDDLAGRLLKEMANDGEQWEVVSLPAIAESEITNYEYRITNADEKTMSEGQDLNSKFDIQNSKLGDPLKRKPGEALCPQRFPVEALLKYQKKLGTYSFSALYQQRPAPAEGGQFKREWFKNIVDAAPNGLSWKRGYDLAISTKTSADYTASFRCAYDDKGNLYIADGFRSRIDYPEQRRYIVARMNEEHDTEHGIESAMHGKAVVQELRTDWNVRRFAFREVSVAGDKLTRALTWLNLAEEGKLFLVRGPWIDAFVDEIVRFPTGRHDDQIDAVSVAVQMLGEFKIRYKSMGF